MNWKLHKVIEQTVVCAREQEIFKKDEQVGQMAVRFVTEQVRLNPHVLYFNLLLNLLESYRVWKFEMREVELLDRVLMRILNE